jgi:hypothetical protein
VPPLGPLVPPLGPLENRRRQTLKR